MFCRGLWLAGMALVGVSLAACVPEQTSFGDRRPVTAAPRALFSDSEPIAFDRLVVSIPSGVKIGTHVACDMCAYEDIFWKAGMALFPQEAIPERFVETMRNAGYRVVGSRSELFDRVSDSTSARYLVGAQIVDVSFRMKQNVYVVAGSWSKGDVRLRVNWQVFSLRDRRVVYETTTEGQGVVDRRGWTNAYTELMSDAVSMAAGALAEDAGFRSTVTRDQAPAAIATAALRNDVSFDLPKYAPYSGPIGNRARDVISAGVTIFGGFSHGSGFLVSDDGLILTNQHVVGDAERVNVRLMSGVELTGTVLRRHALRDVALVKIDIARARPLPLRTGPIGVGAEVYSLGAPADAELAGTLTRGIVSATRRWVDSGVELEMIQSDATIHPGSSGGPLMDASGNVVGIAVLARVDRGRPQAGLNFFIPIDDALQYLNVRLGAARELRF